MRQADKLNATGVASPYEGESKTRSKASAMPWPTPMKHVQRERLPRWLPAGFERP